VPGYEIDPSTTDPEDISAARLAGKVARYGYDKWGIQDVVERAVELAVVTDEAFVWPYWDATCGPIIDPAKGIGVGDVKLRVFSGNEVFWEPGVRFEDSSWWCVQQARTIPDVERMAGFIDGKLVPDATSSNSVGDQRKQSNTELVLVTEYLERPSRKNQNGRRLVIANDQIVCDPADYPCTDLGGRVSDEPVLHKLSYIIDPSNDRDMGLVRHVLDPLRTYLDCWNKQIQWKQMALNPQVIVKNGKLLQKLTDRPGEKYDFVGSGDVSWRQVPPVPDDLEKMKQSALAEIGRIVAQNDIPSQVEAGKAIETLIQADSQRRQPFIARLAAFHSRLMRACLCLVAEYYTEPRLLKIRGRFGPELIEDFKGSQLRSQVDVTVLPGTLAPYSRDQVQAKLTWIATTFPGYLSPEAAIAALDGGTAENLIQSYELDVARANMVIQKIKAGPQVFLAEPMVTGPGGQMETPSWMPRPFDNIAVHKKVFGDWMKTVDYSSAPPEVQEAANLYYEGLQFLEQQQAQQAAVQQTQMAQQLGAANAGRPQAGSEMPDMPGGSTPQPPPTGAQDFSQAA
jgi:hypothetical protein